MDVPWALLIVVSGYLQYSTSLSISLVSPYSTVSPGESLQFKCYGSSRDNCYNIKLMNGLSIYNPSKGYWNQAWFTINRVDSSHSGRYSCSSSSCYRTQTITITVVDLPAPSLSLESGASLIWGQSLQMSCSISTQHLGGTFTLQQRSGSFRNTKSTWRFGYSATFSIPQVDFIHEGDYYCQYQTQVSGRDFTSPQSNTVSFVVTVSLVQPNISVVAPDGGLFWGPQGPEVTRGHSLSILCSTEAQYPGGSFHLLLDASNSTRTQSALNHSASFHIPEIEHSHQGNYSCVYQVTVSSRTFNSTQSEPLTLTVRVQASLAPAVASGVVAGLLILVASLCLVRRKCCRETSPTPHTSHTYRKNSSNHRSSNPYKSRGATAHCDEDGGIYMNTDMPTDEAHRAEDLDHEEEEDEEVYVNVEELRSHSVATARLGCEEDCIYEN